MPASPVPPDAADAAPLGGSDALGPVVPCEVACANLTEFCGPQLDDCEQIFADVERRRERREPSGAPLTCVDIAAATSASAIAALGLSCR